MGRQFPRWTPRILGTTAAFDVDAVAVAGAQCRLTARTLAVLMVRCTCGMDIDIPVEAIHTEEDQQPRIQCAWCLRHWKACLTAFQC
jgi:cobalamin biosynthesis protein CbiG